MKKRSRSCMVTYMIYYYTSSILALNELKPSLVQEKKTPRSRLKAKPVFLELIWGICFGWSPQTFLDQSGVRANGHLHNVPAHRSLCALELLLYNILWEKKILNLFLDIGILNLFLAIWILNLFLAIGILNLFLAIGILNLFLAIRNHIAVRIIKRSNDTYWCSSTFELTKVGIFRLLTWDWRHSPWVFSPHKYAFPPAELN